MRFDWDKNKAKTNQADHQVSFEEATFVFSDEWAIQEFDDSHSDAEENRFTIIGLAETRILSVTYSVEIDDRNEEVIRLISAREARGLDRKDYETNRNEYDW
ncbi:BrnT family toxin [soil metagenome]